MSSESLAAFRKNPSADLRKLAEEHIQHDLTPSDRTILQTATNKLQSYTLVGSLLGLSLGAYLSLRLRTNRTKMYRAFRAREKPTHVRFSDGREEAVPDVTPLLRPTIWGDLATYTLFAGGGVFFGGELGLAAGGFGARRTLQADAEAKGRIDRAFRRFRADVLRKEIERLEADGGGEAGQGRDILEL